MNGTDRVRLDFSYTLLLSNIKCDSLRDRLFNVLYSFKLVKDYGATLSTNDELLNLSALNELIAHLLQQPVLVVNLKLVLKARAPMMLCVKSLHRVDKGVGEVSFCKSDALYLLKGTRLLFTFSACILECLVFCLNSRDLTLNLLLPTVMFVVNPFIGLVLVVTNLVQLGLLLNLKQCLLNCLGQKYVEDRLDFTVVVKEIIVLDLSDLIDTGLFCHVSGRGRACNELIGLALDLCFFRSAGLVLLGQEVC